MQTQDFLNFQYVSTASERQQLLPALLHLQTQSAAISSRGCAALKLQDKFLQFAIKLLVKEEKGMLR